MLILNIGSETLYQWQRLASADMSTALFEHRPGVVPRGESSVVGAGSGGGSGGGSIIRSGFELGSGADDSVSVYSGPAGSSFMQDVEEDDVTYSYSASQQHQQQNENKNSKSKLCSIFSSLKTNAGVFIYIFRQDQRKEARGTKCFGMVSCPKIELYE